MLQAGCDGVKLIEGKPTFRQKLAFPLDGPYYADFFTRAEQLDAPVLWHVADPEEFWDPQRLPAWAAKAGWGYGPKDVPKEQLYREVENVLDRRPRLRVVFAHFYFLSADLPRAGRFLAEHPRVGLDLAPGIEMLYNFSREVNAAREFFLDHQERIFFGTDIASRHQLAQAQARADLVRRFLETDEVFTVPQAADGLLEPGGPARVRGLALPGEVLERVYHANFEAFAGQRPKPVDPPSARRECLAQADIAAAMSNVPPDQTQAGRCAQEIK
jgi:hypothetical protein